MDYLIFRAINNLAGKSVCSDGFGIFLADRFSYVLLGALVLFLLKNYKKYWPMVIKAGIAGIIAWLFIAEIIKFLWVRPRPFVENQVNLLLSHEADGSFPSGHASFFFALSTVVYLYNKKAGIFFFLASALISISRVFVGIHWPSDILGGAIIGIFVGWLVNKIFRKIKIS